VQQSIFAWSAGMSGISPPIVQPRKSPGAADAAAIGLKASPRAQSNARTSLIMGSG